MCEPERSTAIRRRVGQRSHRGFGVTVNRIGSADEKELTMTTPHRRVFVASVDKLSVIHRGERGCAPDVGRGELED